MQLALDDDGGLARQLAALLELGRRARMAGSPAELRFLLVNDSLLLSPYRQSALWSASRGIETLSGLVQPEVNAPYAQWLKALGQHLSQCHGAASSNVGFEAFTAADISVTYALNLGQRNCGISLGDAEQAYLARTTGRDAYKRAVERSHEGVNT